MSPIETIKIHKKLDFINKGNSNFYKPSIITKNVDAKFKPGFRGLYYDFVMSSIFKKKSSFLTSLKDLSAIYEICELIKTVMRLNNLVIYNLKIKKYNHPVPSFFNDGLFLLK